MNVSVSATADTAPIRRYLDSLSNHGIRPGLERMQALMLGLGHPEARFRAIHVTGTNGKGSVCAMLESILREAGFKTGLYTSPHLIDPMERIRISGRAIAPRDFYRIVRALYSKLKSLGLEREITYFEISTAAAFCYFAERRVDIAVVEVGLGGRWDATNVLPNPEACVITNVAMDHMEYLGGTLEKIAAEKAGILKRGVPCITGAAGVGLEVIRKRASDIGSPCTIIRKNNFLGDRFRRALKVLALEGDYQKVNLAAVLGTIEVLKRKGWRLPEGAILRGLKKVLWPARFDVRTLGKTPVVLDGAHNPAAMEELMKTVKKYRLNEKPCLLVFNALKDKSFAPMADSLKRGLKIASVQSPWLPTPRSRDPRDSAQAFSAQCPVRSHKSIESLSKALASERSAADDRGFSWILTTGSLYLAGGVLAALKGRLRKSTFSEAFS